MKSANGKNSVVDASSGEICPDWDPRSAEVQIDQIRAYDQMREACPVAYSEYLGWSLFRHADILRVLTDHETFSNIVSRHPAVPNGMDPPQHTVYRRMIDPYFTQERVEAFEPECRQIAGDLLKALSNAPSFEVMACLAEPYAVRIQCSFLGWPTSLHEPLLQWVRKNRKATLARDTDAMAAIALEFDGHIRSQLQWREEAGDAAPDDITTSLVRQTVDGKQLGHGEIVSILRNWTVGELGTIAACVGIIVHFLAENPEIQRRLRLDRSGLSPAIEEILRLHGPLISNRRTAVRSVEIGGRRIEAGERMTVIWASANRDAEAFEAADAYRPDRDQMPNLLYGAGIHICPGAALARMQLKVMINELLDTIGPFSLVTGAEPLPAVYPASGFASVFLQVDI